jgi:hypothetical protein
MYYELCNGQWSSDAYSILKHSMWRFIFHGYWFCDLLGFIGIDLHLQCHILAHAHCQELQSMALQLGDLEVIIGFRVSLWFCIFFIVIIWVLSVCHDTLRGGGFWTTIGNEKISWTRIVITKFWQVKTSRFVSIHLEAEQTMRSINLYQKFATQPYVFQGCVESIRCLWTMVLIFKDVA